MIKNILATMMVLFVMTSVLAPALAEERRGCFSGHQDWCAGRPDGKGCWTCIYDSFEECKKRTQNSTDNVCRHKSEAK